MPSQLHPYLNFKDNTRAAMEFYQSVFGGKLTMNTFKDLHVAQTPGEENKIVHSVLECDNGITFMASDIPDRMELEYTRGTSFTMSLSGDNEAELRGYFEKLQEGGQVTMPLQKAIWGDTFGMLDDRFGVSWLVDITGQNA